MSLAKEKTRRERVGERVVIRQRGKKKTYVAEYWFDDAHRRKSLKTTVLRVARKRAAILDRQLELGEIESTDRIDQVQVLGAVNDYLDYLEVEQRRPKTIVRYRGELVAFEQFLATINISHLSEITLRSFDKFRAHRADKRELSTLHHEATVCKQFLTWCKQRRLVLSNPLEEMSMKKPPAKQMPVPTLTEMEAIIRSCCPFSRRRLAILAMTGIRIGELQGLKKSNVDTRRGLINIVGQIDGPTKTKGTRGIPIHPQLEPILKKLLAVDQHDLLVTALPSKKYPAGGRPISDKRLNIAMKNATASVVERHYTLHSCRRFFNSFCINQGIPERIVRIWMGHSDRSMTGIYYGLDVNESIRFMQEVDFGDLGKS